MAESAVRRSFEILRFILDHGGAVGIQQVSNAVGYNVSTVHRAMNAMVEERLLFYDSVSRRYQIGAEFLRLAAQALNDTSVAGRMRLLLRALAEELSETAAFNAYEAATKTMVISMVERGPSPLGYDLEIGRRDPIHAGASGKAILASLSAEEKDAYLKRTDLKTVTDATIIDRDKLRQDLALVEQDGYAISHGERIRGAIGVAAPVWSSARDVIGSVLITIPEFRNSGEAIERAKKAVQQTARILSGASISGTDDLFPGK